MLVETLRFNEPTLIGPKRCGEEVCLAKQPACTAIEIGTRTKIFGREALKRVNAAPLAPEFVVELQERLPQARTEAERRDDVGPNGVPRRRKHANLAFRRGQQGRSITKTLVHRAIPPITRQQVRFGPGFDTAA